MAQDFSTRPFRYVGISTAISAARSLTEINDILVANEGWLRGAREERAGLRRMVEKKLETLL